MEILVVIIQFLIEVVGQALVSIPFDCACRIRERREHHPGSHAFVFLIVGGLVGWMSVALVPALVQTTGARIASLVVTPFVSGTLGYFIAKWQSETRNPLLVPQYHFWYTFLFALGLVVVRFAYAKPSAV